MNPKPTDRTPLLPGLLRSPWLWLFASLLVSALLSATHGLTNWWDLVNYHIYNPWALLHHREGLDLFPAGIQGYFDPLLDFPYYFVAYVWLPNHPRLVAALTGLPFGVLAFLMLLLTRRVLRAFGTYGPMARALTVMVVVAMALSGTSVWSQAFTITNEISVGAMVMGAVVLLVKSFDGPSARQLRPARALSIGILLGLAAGLKLTAITYAPAGGLLVLAACRDWKSALRNGAIFFSGWVAAFAISYGPWAMHLYESTGNPFFPMFNEVFHSPLAAAGHSGRDTRFLPQNTMEWLLYPFYWLSDNTQTVFPLRFRDARFALAYTLGLITVLTALAARLRKAGENRTPPQPLLALAAFWFIAYATWLPLFSMLRYAVVLEATGAILASAAVIYYLGQWLPRLSNAARTTAVIVLAVAIMGFTRIPDLGHVPLQTPIFEAEVPRLEPRPLIILANQPMGLLAPLIQHTNPGATFIGIPSCFTRGQWCFNGFYDYGLGRHMRDKIATHEGAMYVAYYADRLPAFPQLDAFHIAVDTDQCNVMRTNRTSNVALCPAHYQPGPITQQPHGTPQFRLAAQIKTVEPNFSLSSHWLHNACSDTTQQGQLTFEWHAPTNVDHVRVFIESPPSLHLKPFAGGGGNGKATTGLWVASAQTFVFTDAAGHELARSSIGYVRCKKSL